MLTYLLICSWFIVGGLTFLYREIHFPSKTRGDYIITLVINSLLGYINGLFALIYFLTKLKENSKWWNEKIN